MEWGLSDSTCSSVARHRCDVALCGGVGSLIYHAGSFLRAPRRLRCFAGVIFKHKVGTRRKAPLEASYMGCQLYDFDDFVGANRTGQLLLSFHDHAVLLGSRVPRNSISPMSPTSTSCRGGSA